MEWVNIGSVERHNSDQHCQPDGLPAVIVAVVTLMGPALLLLHSFPRLPLGSLALRLQPALDLEIAR